MVKVDLDHDYYKDLDLPSTADDEDIRTQFRSLAKRYHPDRNPGEESTVAAKFHAVQRAHEILSEPLVKEQYDARRKRPWVNTHRLLVTRYDSEGNLLHVLRPSLARDHPEFRHRRDHAEHRPSRDPWTGYGSLSNHPEGTIRLLELKPGQKQDALRAFLRPALLQAKYSAISYAWGSEEAQHSILLNSTPFYVRQNLLDCLTHLRHRDVPRLLWIDAICVNQNDIRERESQVRLMDKIYGRAAEVLVWLGVDPVGTKESDDTGWQGLRPLTAHRASATTSRSEYDLSDFLVAKNQVTLRQLRTITDLSQRQYWTRMWIVQEVVLASQIFVHHGHTRTPWDQFISQCRKILDDYSSSYAAPKHSEGETWARSHRSITISRILRLADDRERWHRQGEHHLPLSSLFLTYGRNICSDPRDRIYSLLGMAARPFVSEPSEVLQVSYTSSTADLFLRVAKLYGFIYSEFLLELKSVLSLTLQDILGAHLAKSKGPRHDKMLAPFNMRAVARVRTVLYSTSAAAADVESSQCVHVLHIGPADAVTTSLEPFEIGSSGSHLAVIHCEGSECSRPAPDQIIVFFDQSLPYVLYRPSTSPGLLLKSGIAHPLQEANAWESFLHSSRSKREADALMPQEIELLTPGPTDVRPVFSKAWVRVKDVPQILEYNGYGADNGWWERKKRDNQVRAHLHYIYQKMFDLENAKLVERAPRV